MTPRVLACALLLSCTPLVGQTPSPGQNPVAPPAQTDSGSDNKPQVSIPQSREDASGIHLSQTQSGVLGPLSGQPRLFRFNGRNVLAYVEGLDLGDTVCFSLRTYQVKRDAPDSDSTHPSRYSTCQRASKFGVHTTEDSSGQSSQRP